MIARSRFLGPLLCCLAPIMLAACSGQTTLENVTEPLETVTEPITAPPDPVAGRKVYLAACADCHGDDARGRDAVGDEPGAPDLTLLSKRNAGVFPEERLVLILTGRGGIPGHDTRRMPVWQALARPPRSGAGAVAALYQKAQLEELAAYLRSVQRGEAEAEAVDS